VILQFKTFHRYIKIEEKEKFEKKKIHNINRETERERQMDNIKRDREGKRERSKEQTE
jgi:hypothetical protein